MRILNYQMSAINYVLLSKDICKGVKHVIIGKGGLFYIHSDHHHDIIEILLKVALNTIKQIGFVCLFYTDTLQE
jgi:hypothetical protein